MGSSGRTKAVSEIQKSIAAIVGSTVEDSAIHRERERFGRPILQKKSGLFHAQPSTDWMAITVYPETDLWSANV
jgi:hypothetical protein